jgi:uncharacterized protein with von Willebrand factor type A (vWA) domain
VVCGDYSALLLIWGVRYQLGVVGVWSVFEVVVVAVVVVVGAVAERMRVKVEGVVVVVEVEQAGVGVVAVFMVVVRTGLLLSRFVGLYPIRSF